MSATATLTGYTAASFDAQAQSAFIAALISLLCVAADTVTVTGVSDAPGGRRHLVQLGVLVQFSVSAGTVVAANALSSSLIATPAATLVAALQAKGLTACTAISVSAPMIAAVVVAAPPAGVPPWGNVPPPPHVPSLAAVPPPNITANDVTRANEGSSPLGVIIGAVVGAGIVGPGTVFSIMAIFFKPVLRRQLLKRGFRRLADLVVPDLKGDMAELHVKLQDLERFMRSDVKKLPHLVDTTPEIDEHAVSIDTQEPLGRGGYGVVYRAMLDGRAVAVKALFTTNGTGPHEAVVTSVIKRKMRREAMIMCALNHPNVLHVFGVVPSRGWIVMELCTGGTLVDLLLDPEERLSRLTLMRFAAQTATGIAYLHADDVKILHGDLKAANVLLTEERNVRIADFGLAEAKDRSKSISHTGESNTSGITIAWTAPEVLRNEGKSFASDVFALAITLWEIFERSTPFRGMPDMAAINQLMKDGRLPLSERTPTRAASVISSCWAQDAAARPSAAVAAYVLTKLWREESANGTAEDIVDASLLLPPVATQETPTRSSSSYAGRAPSRAV